MTACMKLNAEAGTELSMLNFEQNNNVDSWAVAFSNSLLTL